MDLIFGIWKSPRATESEKKIIHLQLGSRIDHFTVVELVTWPLNGSEAVVDCVLIDLTAFIV